LQQLDFERIKAHISHHIIAIMHGDPPVNARLECETCGTVLYSADPPRQAEPVRMHQFLLMNGPAVELQVLAPLHLRADLLNIAIVETAKVLAIPLAELASDQVASDQETVWAELCAAARAPVLRGLAAAGNGAPHSRSGGDLARHRWRDAAG
jgi:hypothetical protein